MLTPEQRQSLYEEMIRRQNQHIEDVASSGVDPEEPARQSRLDRSNLISDLGSAVSGLVTAQGQGAGYKPDSGFFDGMKRQAIEKYLNDKRNKSEQVKSYLEASKLRSQQPVQQIELDQNMTKFDTDQAGAKQDQQIKAAAEDRASQIFPKQLDSLAIQNEAGKFSLTTAKENRDSEMGLDSRETGLTRAALAQMTSDPTILNQIKTANARELQKIAGYLKDAKGLSLEEDKITAAKTKEAKPQTSYMTRWQLRDGLALEPGKIDVYRELDNSVQEVEKNLKFLADKVSKNGTFERTDRETLSRIGLLQVQLAKIYGQGALQAPDKEVMDAIIGSPADFIAFLESEGGAKARFNDLIKNLNDSLEARMANAGFEKKSQGQEQWSGSAGSGVGKITDFRDLIKGR